jgi:uncharacterized protein (TIGR02466 family)
LYSNSLLFATDNAYSSLTIIFLTLLFGVSKSMSGSRNDWFPTPIWLFKLDDAQEINKQLLETIYLEKKQDSSGKYSNMMGWESLDNLQQKSSFNEFTNIIQNNVIEVATFLNWDLNKFKVKITNCWAVINHKYAYSSVQNYSNSLLSGMYYVKTPTNCGGIYFNDPRPAAQMIAPPIKDFNMWTLPRITYKPYEGMMLLFPSWLSHGVETILSDEDRVYINFNIGMIPIIE